TQKDTKGHKRNENSSNIEKDSKGQYLYDTKGHKRTENFPNIEKDSKGQQRIFSYKNMLIINSTREMKPVLACKVN
ncbi:hypothetical protein BpHYR1_018965, partial [Brachionus plicatilis]